MARRERPSERLVHTRDSSEGPRAKGEKKSFSFIGARTAESVVAAAGAVSDLAPKCLARGCLAQPLMRRR
eukprot:418318-Pleurochrysis_carterae.AAC.3